VRAVAVTVTALFLTGQGGAAIAFARQAGTGKGPPDDGTTKHDQWKKYRPPKVK
jgi:hypothetical protein